MRTSCSVIAILAMGMSNAAWAQNTPAVQQADAPSESGQLEDIVVTAQKRAQNLQDVPLAVTAVTGETLAATGVTDTAALNVVVPGITIRVRNGDFQPSIRGVSTGAGNVENPVALYIDGVYYPNQREGLRELNDIEQIAVLKGPQGTLFGRNATGGVIQITTRSPSREFNGSIGASVESYGTVRGNAYLSGPLGETLAGSLSGTYVKQFDGYGDNFTTGRDTYRLNHNWSLRGKLLFEPGADTNITLIGDYGRRSGFEGTYYRPFPGTRLAVPDTTPRNVYDSVINYDPIRTVNGGGASLNVEHEFGFARFTSITSYRNTKSHTNIDADASPLTIFHVDGGINHNKDFTEELQLSSLRGSKINWAIGAFYFGANNRVNNFSLTFGGPFTPLPTSTRVISGNGQEKTDSIAPFGQVDFEVLPDTRLTLGGRYTYERRELNVTQSATLVNGTVIPTLASVLGAEKTARKFTYRVALDHKFSERVLGYASYNRGFKSGGFNIINPANPAYNPEQLDAYEIGLKSEFADRRVRLNLAGFYYDYKDVQVVQIVNLPGSTAGVQLITNGAKAELYGLDADLEAQLAPGLTLTAGVELLHNEFTDFRNSVISSPRPAPAGGVIQTTGDVTGNRLPGAQKVSGNIALKYTTPVSFGELNFNASESYNGSYYFEPDNVLKQKSFNLVNMSVGWTSSDEKYSASVFVRNLLDERVLASGASIGIGFMQVAFNPPRIFGASAGVKF